MSQRALLVTLDAWKTLFTPREPIAIQYARVARKHGVVAKESYIASSFEKAFKALSTRFPNYGKQSGMKSDDWWTAVIESTFSPFILPPSLAPALLSHFASASAYKLHPSVPFLLHSLRANVLYSHTVIGVISNGDARVPLVLQDLDVMVRGFQPAHGGKNGVIDFVTLSYDVGIQKPHPRIFDISFAKAREFYAGDNLSWTKVHVGDDIEKDVRAAERAGWRGVLWDGEGQPEFVLKQILGQ